MRLVLFGNNRVAVDAASWLRGQGEDIVGLVLHAARERRYADEIILASGVDRSSVIEAPTLGTAAATERLIWLRAEVGLGHLAAAMATEPLMGFMGRDHVLVQAGHPHSEARPSPGP